MRSMLEQVRSARAVHTRWKLQFMALVEHERAAEVRLVVDCGGACCPLGAWLRSPSRPLVALFESELSEVIRLHAEFHREAQAVARLVADRRFEDARRALLLGSAYGTASDALMQSLLVMIRRLEALVTEEEAAASAAPPCP